MVQLSPSFFSINFDKTTTQHTVKGILSPHPVLYHVKFPPEHDAHSLKAEKLRFQLKNQHLLPKARNSWVQNEVTQVQILEPNQVTGSKVWNQTRLLDPKLGTKTCYSIRYEE